MTADIAYPAAEPAYPAAEPACTAAKPACAAAAIQGDHARFARGGHRE